MRKILVFFISVILFIGALFFYSKKDKNNSQLQNAPEQPLKEYIQDTSQLVLPIEISIASFEKVFNQQMEETEWFYEENGIEVKKNLSISYRVKKDGFAQLFPQDGKIQLSLPLFIEVIPKGSGIYALGLGKDTKLEAKVLLDSSIDIDMDNNWDLVSDAETQFTIQKSPTLKIAGFTIDFNEQLAQNLDLGVEEINKEIENQIQNAINTREIIQMIWEEIKTPYHINAEPFDAWAMLSPVDIAFSQLQPVGPGALGTTFWVNSFLDIKAGKRPIKVNTKKIPKAIKENQLPDAYTHLDFPLSVPFDSFTSFLNDFEKPLSFTIPGNRKLSLSDFSASAEKGQLIVQANFVSGSVKGKLKMRGYPIFDPETQTISVNITEISTDSNKKVVDNLIGTIQKNKTVKTKIEEQMKYSLHDDLADLNFEITSQLKNIRFHEYAKLDGYINNIKINDIHVEEDHFILATIIKASLKCIVEVEQTELVP